MWNKMPDAHERRRDKCPINASYDAQIAKETMK